MFILSYGQTELSVVIMAYLVHKTSRKLFIISVHRVRRFLKLIDASVRFLIIHHTN